MGKMTKEEAKNFFDHWLSSWGDLVKGTRVVDTHDWRDTTKTDGYVLMVEFSQGTPIDTDLIHAMKVLLQGCQSIVACYDTCLRVCIYVKYEDEKQDTWLNVFNKKKE